MSNKITETDLELHAIELLESQDYQYLAPEVQEQERDSLGEVILKDRLKQAIYRINPDKPEDVCDQAFKAVVAVDHTAIQIVKIRGRETATIKRHQRA